MSVSLICFSRNRACQLDLLLQSVKTHIPRLAAQTHVLWRADSLTYREGYDACQRFHPNVVFLEEKDFQVQVDGLLRRAAAYTMFVCDDDVFYRPPQGALPDDFLHANPEVLTVSLRLGVNTLECYPLRRSQQLPRFQRGQSLLRWRWRQAEGDFAYPGSLDGNVWRTPQLRVLLGGCRYGSPNELEDVLNVACRKALLPDMACYSRSILVGSPNNSVQTSYDENRFGERYGHPADDLNDRFLAGMRLMLPNGVLVSGAHQELPLVFT